MFSNASLLSNENFELLLQVGLTELMLTLNGLKEEGFKEITGFSDYNLVKSNIINALKANQEKGFPIKIFVDVYSQYDDTVLEIDDFLTKAKDLGAILKTIKIENAHSWGGKTGKNKIRNRGCERIYNQFGVLFNGDITPCCIDTEGSFVLGNLHDKTLKGIFSDGKYIEMTQLEKNKKIGELKLCEYCNL